MSHARSVAKKIVNDTICASVRMSHARSVAKKIVNDVYIRASVAVDENVQGAKKKARPIGWLASEAIGPSSNVPGQRAIELPVSTKRHVT